MYMYMKTQHVYFLLQIPNLTLGIACSGKPNLSTSIGLTINALKSCNNIIIFIIENYM